MKNFLIMAVFTSIHFYAVSAHAQGQNPDQFFRPVKSNDLITKLPPRVDKNKLFSQNNGDFLSFGGAGSGGCPENVLIGSVDEDTDVFGGVDIDVVIDSDIIINCGGL